MNYKIYCTGDIHGSINDLRYRLAKRDVPSDEDSLVILLGDVGLNYFMDTYDEERKFVLQATGRTYFCIHGNHEERPQNIPSYHEKEWCGGTVYVEDRFPNLLFAKDGEIYHINDINVLVLGGAYSVDKYYRLMRDIKWFQDEQIPEQERNRILKQIKKVKTVHLVLSHTCPYQWQPFDLFIEGLDQSTVDNSMERWLSEVEKNLNYNYWLFGHFHADREINHKAMMLYERVIQIGDMV